MNNYEVMISCKSAKFLPELDALVALGRVQINTLHVSHRDRGSYTPDIDDFLLLLDRISRLKIERLKLRRFNLIFLEFDRSSSVENQDILDILQTSTLKELTFIMCLNIMPVIELVSQYNHRLTIINIDNCHLPLCNPKTFDFFATNFTLREVNITYKAGSDYDPYRANHSMVDRQVANRYQTEADRFTAFLQQIKKITTRNKSMHDGCLAAVYNVLMIQKFSRDSVFAIINRDIARLIAGLILDTKFNLVWSFNSKPTD